MTRSHLWEVRSHQAVNRCCGIYLFLFHWVWCHILTFTKTYWGVKQPFHVGRAAINLNFNIKNSVFFCVFFLFFFLRLILLSILAKFSMPQQLNSNTPQTVYWCNWVFDVPPSQSALSGAMSKLNILRSGNKVNILLVVCSQGGGVFILLVV